MALSSPIIPIMTHQVYWRWGSVLPIDGESSPAWQAAPDVECRSVRLEHGPRGGYARLRHLPVPIDGAVYVGFNSLLTAASSLDDQVRVIVEPRSDELVDLVGDEDCIIFEGVLSRQVASVGGEGPDVSESVDFVAEAWPAIDDQGLCHAVTGPWFTDSLGAFWKTDTPAVPAIFNFRGRSNCSPLPTLVCQGAMSQIPSGSSGGVPAFTTSGSSGDGGVRWTVAGAIASLLGVWLYGVNGYDALPRNVDVEPALITALGAALAGSDPADVAKRFAGLENPLPEVNVTGLGVFSAVERVCQAAGFDMAIVPPVLQATPCERGDRLYQLTIWKRGQGRAANLKMGKRRTSYSSAASALAANNVTQLRVMKDAQAVRNSIVGLSRTQIEARWILRPLWKPADVSEDIVDAVLQQATSVQLAGDGYHSWHLPEGARFGEFGHVGRRWGLACRPGFWGYDLLPDGNVYYQNPNGYDFVEALKLNLAGGKIAEQRLYNGVVDPITWDERPRQALPMFDRGGNGPDYILEVCENAHLPSSQWTWSKVAAPFSPLADEFGIELRVHNLACVNAAYYRTGVTPAAASSWWAMIAASRDGFYQLLFRLTCVIEADHAARVNSVDAGGLSASLYSRSQVVLSSGIDRWVAPKSPNNMGTEWVTLPGTAMNFHEASVRRGRLQYARVSGMAEIFPPSLRSYRLGDRVESVVGRNWPLSANRGEPAVFPNVVGMEFVLAPGGEQTQRLELEDAAMASGREEH